MPIIILLTKRGKPLSKRTSLIRRVGLQLPAGALLFADMHMNRLTSGARFDNSAGSCDPILRDFHGDSRHRLFLLSFNRGQYCKACFGYLLSTRIVGSTPRSLCDP